MGYAVSVSGKFASPIVTQFVELRASEMEKKRRIPPHIAQ